MSNAISYVLSHIPERLPQTGAEVYNFSTAVLQLAGLDDNDTYRMSIATNLLHLDINKIKASKQHFVKMLLRAVSNQAAYSIIEDLRVKAKAANEPVQQSQV